ncbi:hypothetical protein Tco_1572107, partial [Tanacetum coccineum]
FLQQLQPEWSRFVTIVKQQHDLDTVSYHKLFDVLKQYQKEVNEICAERIAKNANPLALVATAQQYPDPYYQAPKPHRSLAQPLKQSSSTRSNITTKFKGKEIAKPITPPSDSTNLPTTTSEPLQTLDTRYVKDNQTGQFRNQRTMIVTGARETEGSQETKKAQQADWLADTDEEIDEQELEAHYRQHCEKPESISNTCVVEKVDSNVIPNLPDMCDNDIQTDQNAEDEHAALANLIANLKLDV